MSRPFNRDVNIVSTGVQALVESANRLGLIWNLRPATVVALVEEQVTVVMDGDTEVVTTTSLIGPPPIDGRVMVLIVPPAGLFIIGLPGGISYPRYGNFWAGEASQTDSSAIGAEAVLMNTPPVLYYEGRAYKFSYGGWVTASTTNTVTFRVREDTISGTIQINSNLFSGSTSTRPMESRCILRCIGTRELSWALTMEASTGTAIQNGNATRPRWFTVEDVGPDDDYEDWPSF